MLAVGTAGMAAAMLSLGLEFFYQAHQLDGGSTKVTGVIGIFCIFVYTACNAFSASGVIWIVVSGIWCMGSVDDKDVGLQTHFLWKWF